MLRRCLHWPKTLLLSCLSCASVCSRRISTASAISLGVAHTCRNTQERSGSVSRNSQRRGLTQHTEWARGVRAACPAKGRTHACTSYDMVAFVVGISERFLLRRVAAGHLHPPLEPAADSRQHHRPASANATHLLREGERFRPNSHVRIRGHLPHQRDRTIRHGFSH